MSEVERARSRSPPVQLGQQVPLYRDRLQPRGPPRGRAPPAPMSRNNGMLRREGGFARAPPAPARAVGGFRGRRPAPRDTVEYRETENRQSFADNVDGYQGYDGYSGSRNDPFSNSSKGMTMTAVQTVNELKQASTHEVKEVSSREVKEVSSREVKKVSSQEVKKVSSQEVKKVSSQEVEVVVFRVAVSLTCLIQMRDGTHGRSEKREKLDLVTGLVLNVCLVTLLIGPRVISVRKKKVTMHQKRHP
ncbi:hypothetical protein ACHWQZ_G018140 [Mnemiopsis leidyi]